MNQDRNNFMNIRSIKLVTVVTFCFRWLLTEAHTDLYMTQIKADQTQNLAYDN